MELLGAVLSTERCKMAEISLEQTEIPLPVEEHAVADHIPTLFFSGTHSYLSVYC